MVRAGPHARELQPADTTYTTKPRQNIYQSVHNNQLISISLPKSTTWLIFVRTNENSYLAIQNTSRGRLIFFKTNKYGTPSVPAVVERSWDIWNWNCEKSTGAGRKVCIEGHMGCVRWCKGKKERVWCWEGGYGKLAVRVPCCLR